MDLSDRLKAEATHVYPFSAELVFSAWLEPAWIGRWMFGPAIRDESVVSIEIDPHEGGAFSFLVSRGNQVIDHVGTYAQIVKPHLLDFDWGVKGMSDKSRVSVKITPTANGCELNLTHYLDPAWKEYLQRSIDGWKQMLSVLETALHNHQTTANT